MAALAAYFSLVIFETTENQGEVVYRSLDQVRIQWLGTLGAAAPVLPPGVLHLLLYHTGIAALYLD